MKWISVKDRLPEEGKYVLARHNRHTWNDDDDQNNVNCVVVKLKKGISKEERELMKEGRLDCKTIRMIDCGGLWSGSSRDIPRYNIRRAEDEDGNNLVPYNWDSFGATSFNGQEITYWTNIEPLYVKI